LNPDLSIELPDSISDLVTPEVFDRYTVPGPVAVSESTLLDLDEADLWPGGVGNSDLASCCLSGLLLLHNFLDLSHEISQAIHSREGSFWHAIMHRMEGDFSNSKYWYRKVGRHPVMDNIPAEGDWDPFEFVDQCENSQRTGGLAARQVQRTAVAEWKTLFEFCFRNAGM
jgi:hypothetical protein